MNKKPEINVVLAAAKASFEQRMSGELQYIDVPEWDNARIYFKPCLTLKQKGDLYSHAGDPANLVFTEFIYRALDAKGQPLFKSADRADFMHHIDPDEVSDILARIKSLEPEITDEEAAKN